VGIRHTGWLAQSNQWNVNGAEEASRKCSTGHTVVVPGTRPNHPWHRGDTGYGRPVVVGDGDVDGCEPEEVRSSIETVAAKERCQQRNSCRPCDEGKAEVRPVPPHYRTVYTFTALRISTLHSNSEYPDQRSLGVPAFARCAFVVGCVWTVRRYGPVHESSRKSDAIPAAAG
jgi:hypothetical protein